MLAHTPVMGGFEAPTGELEPLVGQNWHPQRGAGRELITLAAACLAPGSRVKVATQAEISLDDL